MRKQLLLLILCSSIFTPMARADRHSHEEKACECKVSGSYTSLLLNGTATQSWYGTGGSEMLNCVNFETQQNYCQGSRPDCSCGVNGSYTSFSVNDTVVQSWYGTGGSEMVNCASYQSQQAYCPRGRESHACECKVSGSYTSLLLNGTATQSWYGTGGSEMLNCVNFETQQNYCAGAKPNCSCSVNGSYTSFSVNDTAVQSWYGTGGSEMISCTNYLDQQSYCGGDSHGGHHDDGEKNSSSCECKASGSYTSLLLNGTATQSWYGTSGSEMLTCVNFETQQSYCKNSEATCDCEASGSYTTFSVNGTAVQSWYGTSGSEMVSCMNYQIQQKYCGHKHHESPCNCSVSGSYTTLTLNGTAVQSWYGTSGNEMVSCVTFEKQQPYCK